jgi:hypothetical protein
MSEGMKLAHYISTAQPFLWVRLICGYGGSPGYLFAMGYFRIEITRQYAQIIVQNESGRLGISIGYFLNVFCLSLPPGSGFVSTD